jgi:oligo-1,6-glucosidase
MGRTTRDQGRTPVQWDASRHAGFTTGEPWIAVNPDHVTVNAAAQTDDPDSVFAHHRRLVALRHTDPLVTDGAFALLLPDDERVWAFTRRGADGELLVLANCSSEPVRVDLDAAGEVVLATHSDPAPPALRPWESVVLRRPPAR